MKWLIHQLRLCNKARLGYRCHGGNNFDECR